MTATSKRLPSHLTLSQAARLAGVTRQAIDYAINVAGRLEAEDVLGAPMVRTADVRRLWSNPAPTGSAARESRRA